MWKIPFERREDLESQCVRHRRQANARGHDRVGRRAGGRYLRRVAALAVVIPTRDRPDLLRDCLRGLTTQTFSDIEVLVVDDGSLTPLAPLVASVDPSFRCHRHDPVGLNTSRNAGAELTTAPLIAFLDDDTLVPPTWSGAVVRAFTETACAGVGGRVTLDMPTAPPRWLTAKRRRYLAEFDLGPSRRWLDDGPVPVGANCAVRRSEIDRIGPFADGLDRVGASLISSGDTEFFLRLQRQGGRLLYDPDTCVAHRVASERMSVEWFHRRAHAQGVSDGRLAAHVGGPRRSPSRRRLREHARAARAVPILAKGLAQGRGATNARLWLSYCRGRRSAIDVARRS